jgi:hypothetical protein
VVGQNGPTQSHDRDQHFQAENDENALEKAVCILKSLRFVKKDIVIGDWEKDEHDSEYDSLDLYDADDHKIFVGCLRRKTNLE